MKYFRQCELKNKNKIIISWIPERYAKTGKLLKLKNNDVWEDGWLVNKIYNKKTEMSVIRDSELFKKMRTVTDV
jgi:hypothetical protein